MPARRALITGIAGQDGSYLAELLLEKGYEVHGMIREDADRSAENLAGIAGHLTLRRAELLQPASLRELVAEASPDELYHLAAPTFVPASWEDPAAAVAAIAGATGTLLAALQGSGARIWVAASSEVFGDCGASPQHEGSVMRPRSPYGVAKLAALGLARAVRERHGTFAACGILYNHESPRRPERFLPRKVTRAVAAMALGSEEQLELGSLDAVRDWCHAKDVARAAWLALQRDVPDDYVIASGVGRTVAELVEVAFAAAGVSAQGRVTVDRSLVRPPESTPLVGDPSRARAVLGWTPEISFEAMVGEMVAADIARLRAAS